ncbi:hypothetical protein QJS10_CPA02g00993 [Acorus calamus]|uniref:Uncharacterized protein n=1 Tax=Acorus calamus TaxID=4465 RepID=A0AAV9FD83_ACOCL|nr:hypothetical protein QJS10_CPA02g00993 [Acorus calamus]
MEIEEEGPPSSASSLPRDSSALCYLWDNGILAAKKPDDEETEFLNQVEDFSLPQKFHVKEEE